jgi:hypothetical protein
MDPLQELAQHMHDAGTLQLVPEAPQLPVAKASYTHEAMVALMVENPNYSHGQLASHFGRPASWFSAVLASEAFQQVLDSRRHEVADPSLTATMEERFRALALRSVTVLQEKLNSSGVSDLVVLKAAEIGVKALGMGQRAPELPAPVTNNSSSESVAEKLLAAMDARDRQRTVDVETVEVKDGE